MSGDIRPVRGMNDIYGDVAPYWDRVEQAAQEVLVEYGYREIRLPLMERTELFKRSIGEGTDVVQKEMYTFESRSGASLTLRPEATASCVRACLTHGLLHNQRQRMWYRGPMFRYERPQKGRYRQFHQIGAEAFGFPGPDIDAELIFLCARLWSKLGLDDLTLQINSLGTPQSRSLYREKLLDYLQANIDVLDEDSRKRLQINPLRILDSKNPALAELIAAAPRLTDHLDDESAQHFDLLQQLLSDSGIGFTVNPLLVRGLDYYTKTVFEWETDKLGAQAAVCSGGRYDGLVTQLGGKPTPGCGWALGVERLVELLQLAEVPADPGAPDVYLVMVGSAATRAGMALGERLRSEVPGLRLVSHCGGGSFKSQLRAADRSGAALALILGDEETAGQRIGFKPLRIDEEQASYSWDELGKRVAAFLN
ncbi:MAG: histidine--tRNA ligase [Gammaproteobacteria bacterium]|nr:histidine--tRNA ligase [Gammaproteobacteria bacterium]